MIPRIPKNGSYLEKKKMRDKEIKNKNIRYVTKLTLKDYKWGPEVCELF